MFVAYSVYKYDAIVCVPFNCKGDLPKWAKFLGIQTFSHVTDTGMFVVIIFLQCN